MITRAYRKNMVIVRGIESDIVEEAYLFIREDSCGTEEESIVREADRIIRACSRRDGKPRFKIPSAVLWFLGGAAAAVSVLLLFFI